MTHPKLYAAFLRGVRFLDDEGVFVVQLRQFRGQIEVEDTPWWVVSYDGVSGEIELTDGSRERLRVDSLSADPDDVLRCTVKGHFPARFTHAGQAMLLNELDLDADPVRLRVGDRRQSLPDSVAGAL